MRPNDKKITGIYAFSLFCGMISVVSLICAYFIAYPIRSNHPALYQAIPQNTTAILLLFVLVFSILGVIVSLIVGKKRKGMKAAWYVNVILCSLLSICSIIMWAIGFFWAYVFSQ